MMKSASSIRDRFHRKHRTANCAVRSGNCYKTITLRAMEVRWGGYQGKRVGDFSRDLNRIDLVMIVIEILRCTSAEQISR
jgi:hypothetical protein